MINATVLRLAASSLAAVVLMLMVCASSGVAHPISLSAAAVNIREDKALVNLKIMLEDLVLYHNLQAGADERFPYDDLVAAAQKHRDFVLAYFTVRDAAGEVVPGEILRVDLSHIPKDGARQSQLMAHDVFYHLEFPLAQRQEFLTLTQTFGGEAAVLPAVMELVVFQNRALIQRPTQLLQSSAYTVKLDWENPPTPSAFNPQTYRQQKQAEAQRQLGITSYSGLYSFIYITDHEIRHEILFPLLTFEKWLPIPRSDPDFLEVAEQQAASASIAAFFRDRNPVNVNGETIAPTVKRLQFFGLDIRDFATNAEPSPISAYQARLGVILSYPLKQPPQEVWMTWELFNPYVSFLRSVVLVHDREPMIHHFREKSKRFFWTREGDAPTGARFDVPKPELPARWSLPLISIACGIGALIWIAVTRRQWRLGALLLLILVLLSWPWGRVEMHSPFAPRPEVTEPQARDVTFALLRNIYRAFDYHTEEDVYDVLARSVDGQLLDTLYLQMQKTLQMQEQGGAIARVKDVQLIEHQLVASQVSRVGLPQLDVQCRWQIEGTVEHWGHIHTRVNEYQAVFKVSAQPDAWKMTAYEMLNEQRVRVETGLRQAKRER